MSISPCAVFKCLGDETRPRIMLQVPGRAGEMQLLRCGRKAAQSGHNLETAQATGKGNA